MFAKLSFFRGNTVLGGLAALVIAFGSLSVAQYNSFGVAAQIANNNVATPLPQAEPTPAQTALVPDKVVYGIFFRQIAAFNAKADEMEKNGGDGRSLRRHFARIAGLNDAESELLDRIVADYIREASLINARQKAMVDAYRIKYPGGQIPNGGTRERPPSYHEFTLEREQLYLRMRDQLQTVLGAETFAHLDTALRSKIAGNPQSALGAPAPSAPQETQEESP